LQKKYFSFGIADFPFLSLADIINLASLRNWNDACLLAEEE